MPLLRRAVIQHLKAQVSALGGRVYQAFLAPPGTARPYATVKAATSRGSIVISYAGTQTIEVRLYDDPASAVALDQIEVAVISALHGIEIQDAAESPPGTYRLDWVPGGGDFHDDEMGLIGRLMVFEAALLFERG